MPSLVPGTLVPPRIQGDTIDEATRCMHHGKPEDIVAFRFRCCQEWYPCRACHDENVDHGTETWRPGELNEHAVLCGACKTTMTLDAYIACQHACPYCGTSFNPACKTHWDRYFER